jgi:hypothetical protein
VYETYDARTVAVLDVKDPGCRVAAHRVDAEMDATPGSGPFGPGRTDHGAVPNV